MFTQRSKSKSVSQSKSVNELPLIETVEDRTLFATYVVTNTNDSGTGSLRAAITASNKHAGKDRITFSIGSGAKTITPLTQLPQLTGAVAIDATTQPGHAKKPIIELNGTKAGGYGLTIRGGHSEVTGLVINHFSSGILIVGGGYNTVAGNYIGTDISGYHAAGNSDKGIIVQSNNNLIGGAGKYGRNVISSNAKNGIQLYTSAAKGNIVASNFIGTDADGAHALPNGSGIGITGGVSNVIGGRGTSQRNVISGNSFDGVVVNNGGQHNAISGNYIGTTYSGSSKLGNGNYGVEISDASNVVGGARQGQGNVISGNAYSGIALWLSSAHDNVVLGNYIGTDASGKKALGNAWSGIDVTSGATNNTIGGTRTGAGNLISGNVQSGVKQYLGGNNVYVGNTLGFNAKRSAALANGHDGIQFVYTHGGTVVKNYIGNNAASAVAKIGSSNVTLGKNTIVNDTLYGF